ncbi:MAG: VCBS repeat-containing protein, partial [Verrucomicrobia bacterium]|nr:VCBS repeat-containing protein [Verrucomicrobiota bacterium]
AGLGGGNDWAAGVVFADVDNDGDLDIYVCNYDSPNALFLNELAKGGSSPVGFREAAAEFGLDLVGRLSDAQLLRLR